jgi:restriction system protein
MYGNGGRSVNRQMIMNLCGAMHYFDCTSAALVTDGRLLPDAWQVAEKLKIEIIVLPAISPSTISPQTKGTSVFDAIWMNSIMPLAGKTLERGNGKANKILHVDWSGLNRLTSNNKEQHIQIEIFRSTVDGLIAEGKVLRSWMNNEYPGRASSGICLILSQVPGIDYDANEGALRWTGSPNAFEK